MIMTFNAVTLCIAQFYWDLLLASSCSLQYGDNILNKYQGT